LPSGEAFVLNCVRRVPGWLWLLLAASCAVSALAAYDREYDSGAAAAKLRGEPGAEDVLARFEELRRQDRLRLPVYSGLAAAFSVLGARRLIRRALSAASAEHDGPLGHGPQDR
jgi:hypothetical protein